VVDFRPAKDTVQYCVNEGLKGKVVRWEIELGVDAVIPGQATLMLVPKWVVEADTEGKVVPFVNAIIFNGHQAKLPAGALTRRQRIVFEGTIGDAAKNHHRLNSFHFHGPTAIHYLGDAPHPIFWLGFDKVTVTRLDPTEEQLQVLLDRPSAAKTRLIGLAKPVAAKTPVVATVKKAMTPATQSIGMAVSDAPRATVRQGPNANIVFANQTLDVVRIFWRGYEGQLISYGELMPNAKRKLGSYGGHVWEIQDVHGNGLVAFIALDVDSVAIIPGRIEPVTESEKAAAKKAEAKVAGKIPDVATVKRAMTPDQLALGDPITNSIGMVLVPIPAGEFQMGSPDSDRDANDNEKPQNLVHITKPFYVSAYEVTQQQYEKVMGTRPWQGKDYVQKGPGNPATNISWNDAVEFCGKLSEQEGVEYRLPTEAEWDYACRAGTTTLFNFGDEKSKLGQHAWYDKNAWEIGERYAHPVGQKLPNAWGLFDMHGNVFEWCQDWHGPYENAEVDDPSGPPFGKYRVLRGGSFSFDAVGCRSAFRELRPPGHRLNIYGFRVSRTYN
jgi:formylglycine-generating enzyme required for sulfatase activity